MLHRAEAVVLRTWPVHEADFLISLFTREFGKLKGIAKSAAKSRRRFGGALEPMTHVRASFVVKPRQELVRLDTFDILASPLAQPVDYPRAAALAFFAEVLEETLPEHDPQDAVFRLLLAVLDHTRAGCIWMPVTYFALWMTRLNGWLPSLGYCTVCGRPFAPGAAWWQPETDGLLCADHRRSASRLLHPESLQLASRILHSPVTAFAPETWPARRASDLRVFAVEALERHLERRLTTASALRRIAAEG